MTPHRLNGTLLARNHWMDNTQLHYELKPILICSHCNGCCANFTAEHGLSCNTGGLIGIQHNNARHEARVLAALVLTQGKISYKPTIHYGSDLAT